MKIKDKHIKVFDIWLIFSNGQLIFTDPTTPDNDGDGLLDGEEIVVTYDQKYIHGAGNNGSSISNAWNLISKVKVNTYNDDIYGGIITTPKGLYLYLKSLDEGKLNYPFPAQYQ